MTTKPALPILDHWWHALAALPPGKNTPAYDRLRHLWIDPTRTRTCGGQRIQEFYNPAWETHITAVLWETFSCLPATVWLPNLIEAAGLQIPVTGVVVANWSYGWVCEDPERRIMDIVVNYLTATRGEVVITVEVKTPWCLLQKGKDTDPGYYLGVPAFKSFGTKGQIYLLDEEAIPDARELVEAGSYSVGFLSWQQLATIQMNAVQYLPIPEDLKAFVAGSIHRQFRSYGIEPSLPPLDYLNREPSRSAIDAIPGPRRQSNAERQHERWRVKRTPIATTAS